MAVKIQIDNSLSLGWKPEDIMLVTNFKYEYGGVKSIVAHVKPCPYHFPLNKIKTIRYLFKNGFIKHGLYWYHDFDCFQLNPFIGTNPEIGDADMGLAQYGRMPRLCSASMFFTKNAEDIFDGLIERCDKYEMDEENGIAGLINRNEDLKNRIKKINTSYAFHKFNLINCYNMATKPLKAAHFHLTPDKYDFYVRGVNKMGKPLIPIRLVKIFHKHGFTG